jgi:hypothetical protein
MRLVWVINSHVELDQVNLRHSSVLNFKKQQYQSHE